MTYSRTSILSVDLPEEMLDGIREMFQLFDRDGTGTIATRDLGVVMRAVGLVPTEAEVAALRLKLDTEKKGNVELVDFVEMAANLSKATTADPRGELMRALAEFDHAGDGHIAAADFRYAMTSLGEKIPHEDLREFAKVMDISARGRINCQALVDKLIPSTD